MKCKQQSISKGMSSGNRCCKANVTGNWVESDNGHLGKGTIQCGKQGLPGGGFELRCD